ncbi:Planctomycete cytochrome C [Novipirellula galeiformis]|uniref:Planctomycete cytochrome C n=1 Tax=Novipirellula galeiformis TaxID=2528004 RepID=A0A5C6BZE6_9BACT|nr:PSD1 and planctomycete cytochrome C domain-containing protein [Novipirellula galeiformis]TWU17232.1 Planctomycete cytochrome C [Novipirellula galeiformis]
MGRFPIFATTLLAIAVSASLGFGKEPAADGKDSPGMVLFKTKIEPVLKSHCYECHSKGADEIAVGLELDSPTGLMRGGDSGPVVIPHDPAKSLLIRMLRHDDDVSPMPPEEKLSSEVFTAFEEWVRLGAPDSRSDQGLTARDERYEAGRRHWSFQSPVGVDPPVVQQADWPRSVIDEFVLSTMESEGVKPVADASRRTLVRRIFFDLVGLPPSAELLEQFANDDSPEAIAKLIDHLLESPQFGERWGRHWLDVVRYAESSGMEFNFTYPHAWPYRDYVIDAFNQDKPYDVFVREQIAGDLMPVGESDTPEAVEARRIAVSILSFGPKRHNSRGTPFRMDVADDQIDTVFRATMGLTVACARCHDHKFDPIPTKDYYSLAGIFMSTEPLFGTIKQTYSNTPTDLLPIGPDAAAKHAAAEAHDKKIDEATKQVAAKKEALKKAGEAEKVAADTKAADTKADDAKAKAAAKLVADLQAEVTSLEAKLAELKKNRPARPQYAMTARDRDKPADIHVAIRGNLGDKGELAPRGFLSAVSMPDSPVIQAGHSGRLELAQWISSPDNPLTARVMVNRIWHHLFGSGLVPSVDNFGLIGKQPVHPELLDTLALQFIETDWSVKQMIRKIMLSRVYQLSSTRDAENMKLDPLNRLYWRSQPRRLEAEAIRDAILCVSGQLDLNRPEGSTVTALGDTLARGVATEKLQPPSNHRSVYLPIVRDYIPELFDLFDFPSPSLVSGSRSVTNVPAQSLYLRNSTFVAEQAKHASQRLLASPEASNDEQRVELALRWALARPVTDAERSAALALVKQIQELESDPKVRDVNAWAAWFQTLFTTAEFRYLVDVP